MESIDTNVVVRLLVQDDDDQCRRAEALLRRLIANGGAYISQLALAETVWVLRSAYGFDRRTTASALHKLIATRGVFVEQKASTLASLEAFEIGVADLADYMIHATADRAGALPLWTFDKRLAQVEGVQQVP